MRQPCRWSGGGSYGRTVLACLFGGPGGRPRVLRPALWAGAWARLAWLVWLGVAPAGSLLFLEGIKGSFVKLPFVRAV